MSRARHNNYSSSLAFIKVYHRGIAHDLSRPIEPAKAVRIILTSLEPNIREEDIFAYLGDNVFALLLPHMPGAAAKDLLSFLRTQIGLISPNQISEGQSTAIYSSIGVVYSRLHSTPDELLAQATQALKEADTAVYGKVHQFTPTDTLTHHANGRSPVGKLSTEAGR